MSPLSLLTLALSHSSTQQPLQSRCCCCRRRAHNKAALLYDQPLCSLLSVPPLEVITHKVESQTGECAVNGCSLMIYNNVKIKSAGR